MILIQPTIDQYGYDPSTLKAGSNKKIIIQCSDCLQPFHRTRAHVRDTEDYQCRVCSSKRQVLTLAASETVKKNRKDTLLKKFGVDNLANIPGVTEKRKQTCLERYGKEHFYQTEQWRKDTQCKNLEKYGVPWFFQTDEHKKKAIETNLVRYNTPYPMVSEGIKIRQQQTCLDRYGVKNVSYLPQTVTKILSTKLTKYGTTSPTGIGQEEEHIKDWLQSLGIITVKSHTVLPGKELDLYCAEAAIAIEYNGLYWHCEKFDSNPKRHFDKWKKCKELNIRLITIFEDEWLHRQAQVKNFLRAVFGKNTIKVFARNCVVKEITAKVAREFLDVAHIQGAAHTFTHAAGLYFGNPEQLYGVMTFGRHHRGGDNVVLSRLAFADNVTVVGGSSKLFKFLLRKTNPLKVISWSDNRWSDGKVYPALGFKLAAQLPVDYSYVDVSRSNAPRKSKQAKRKAVTRCPTQIKEADWNKAAGFYRIWDCGKIRWEWVKSDKATT